MWNLETYGTETKSLTNTSIISSLYTQNRDAQNLTGMESPATAKYSVEHYYFGFRGHVLLLCFSTAE